MVQLTDEMGKSNPHGLNHLLVVVVFRMYAPGVELGMKWARIWNAATFGRITGNSNAREAGLREVIQIAPRRWRPRARHDKVEVNAHLMVYAKG